MKVKELIERLQQYSGERHVVCMSFHDILDVVDIYEWTSKDSDLDPLPIEIVLE
jgi:hypothetical protein